MQGLQQQPALSPPIVPDNGQPSPEAFPDESTESCTAKELMEWIVRGNEGAISELYDRYSSTLLGLARQILNSTHDAEEVVQEVFLQIWRQAGQYDPSRATVSTWLILITRRKAIDRLRRARTAAKLASEVRQESAARPPVASPEGSQRVLASERRRRIAAALCELPPEQRKVLELAYFQELTQSQIAEAIQIPLGTVKTRSVLAMKKLRRALQNELPALT